MPFRIKEDVTVQSYAPLLGELGPVTFKAGVVEPKSEQEEALLAELVVMGHAEVVEAEAKTSAKAKT